MFSQAVEMMIYVAGGCSSVTTRLRRSRGEGKVDSRFVSRDDDR